MSMNLKEAFFICVQLLKEKAKENPGGGITVAGEKIPYTQAVQEMKRVCEWTYPELSTGDVQRVVHCERCTFYKRYRKKGSLKKTVKRLCSLNHIERSPDFFCKDGKEKTDESP